MAFLEIHPAFREKLAGHGLVSVSDLLSLPGVICCGHPDRNVARVTLGQGIDGLPAFLKREHRTRWRDRLANAWAGFGFVTKSRREFAMLQALEATGISGPQAIAAAEDDKGRAFLLVRELEGSQDLRHCLGEMNNSPLPVRRQFARQLGTALARMHNAGFEHTDLYSKHVHVNQTTDQGWTFAVLDWQRGRRRPHVGWPTRWRELAALDATLAEALATPRDRLGVLHAYLRVCRAFQHRQTIPQLRTAVGEIRRRSMRLLERRRIREMRLPPLPTGTQELIWVDGEAMQVTPDCLNKGTRTVSGNGPRPLIRSRPWRWLWSLMRRRPLIAPEVESMKLIFRLERYGVVVPKLIAVGQKQIKPWVIESFLLTEPRQGGVPLLKFLREADPAKRREVLRLAARAVRQMHHATCYVERCHGVAVTDKLAVTCHDKNVPGVALATVQGLEKSHSVNPARAHGDLAAAVKSLSPICSRTELLHGLLAYTGQKRLSFAGKMFVRRILKRLPASSARRRVAA